MEGVDSSPATTSATATSTTRTRGKGEKTLTFQPELPEAGKYEVWLAYSPGTNRADTVPVTVFSADGEKTVHVDMKKAPPIDGRFVSLGRVPVREERAGLRAWSPTRGRRGTSPPTPWRSSRSTAPRRPRRPASRREAGGRRVKDAGGRAEEAQGERARSGDDGDVRRRGGEDRGRPGPRPRQRPQPRRAGAARVPAGGDRRARRRRCPANQSGRRELAEWLARRDNPLTARVFVNRAWHWLFGAGLVRTTDNFGTTGETPVAPRAARRPGGPVHGGRLVGQVAGPADRAVAAPTGSSAPTTRRPRRPTRRTGCSGRANRRRLDAECIRDTMLAVSGQLDAATRRADVPAEPRRRLRLQARPTPGGASTRRCSATPCPSCSRCSTSPTRAWSSAGANVSTVAPQALFLMNHPFVARAGAARGRAGCWPRPLPDDAARIDRAYRLTLGRPPTRRRAADRRCEFLRRTPADAGGGVGAGLFQALFASADFRYVD